MAARLKPSCAHISSLPVCYRWGELPRRCRQRRRNHGLREVHYSNTQLIVDGCGWACSLLVSICPSLNEDYVACDLICTSCASQDGGALSSCRPSIPRSYQKREIRSRSRVRVYSAAQRSRLDCAPPSSTLRAKSKANLFSGSSPMPPRRLLHSS